MCSIQINRNKTKFLKRKRDGKQKTEVWHKGKTITGYYTQIPEESYNVGQHTYTDIKLEQGRNNLSGRGVCCLQFVILQKIENIFCMKIFIWSIYVGLLAYTLKMCILRKADRRKFETFDMWCWKSILKIQWMERVTKGEVLTRIGNY